MVSILLVTSLTISTTELSYITEKDKYFKDSIFLKQVKRDFQ